MNLEKLGNIREALAYSDERLTEIRAAVSGVLGNRNDVCVVTVGSLARREASAQSDLDYFVIANNGSDAKALVDEALRRLDVKPPSAGGPFGKTIEPDELTGTIGGLDDDNDRLTRRMLFLLESDWLYNDDLYLKHFADLIDRYVKDTITESQLARFLLNDLIRYYRTIAVDFEHKTTDGGKTWGDRNIKLMFSRKMIYFSGILAIAETAQRTPASKREVLQKYLRMTPLQRASEICGLGADSILARYDAFLGKMKDPDVRGLLQRTKDLASGHSPEFRDFKNDGHHFSWELYRVLSTIYDVAHPIHQAIAF